MNSHLKLLAGFFLFFILFFQSCKKDEGYGGKTTIKGKIIEKIYDESFSALHRTRPSADEDVFLVFGNSNYVDDDTKTSASGDFEFKNLLPGNYKIYFYSIDSSNYYPGKKIAIIKEFTISKNDEVIDLGELIKLEVVDYDEGNTIVKGNLTEYVYINDFSVLQKLHPAMDEEIFLTYANNNLILDKVNTSQEGNFEFKYLLPGNYKIYYYSVDSANYIPGNKIAMVKEFSVTENDTLLNLGTLKKFKTLDFNEGNAVVKGNLLELIYDNDFSVLQKSHPAMDENIFLSFSNSTSILDDVKTSEEGNFEFKYLLPGNYKIYYYSVDSANYIPGNKIAMVKEFSVTENDAILDLDTLKKFKTLDFNEGSGTIKGVFMTIFYKSFSPIDMYPSQNEDVFLVYNDHSFIDDRIRTMYNGSYAFTNLIKGKYLVYALSYDPTKTSDNMRYVSKEVNITDDNQVITLDTLYINRK